MKRFVLLLIAACGLTALAAGAATTKSSGWISDSMCGAKHMGTGQDCVKKCISMGAAPVFVDAESKAVWAIDNPAAVKGFYGDHVTIMATKDAAKKSVHIDTIAEIK